MEPNSISRALNSLEDSGYLARKQDEKDQRKVLVILTPEGRKLRKIALKTVFGLEKDIEDKIGTKNLKIFYDVMQKINVALDEFGKDLEK